MYFKCVAKEQIILRGLDKNIQTNCYFYSSTRSVFEDVHPVQVVMALVDHHHVPPLLHVGPLRPGHHQHRLVEIDEGEGLHGHVSTFKYGNQIVEKIL